MTQYKGDYCPKTKYTKKEAKTALNAASNRRMNNKRERLRIYECPACGGWHLTSKAPLWED